MGETRNAVIILDGISEGKIPAERPRMLKK
jgi:hypothetical protein